MVPTVTCGAIVERFGAPSHAKVDVEGADLACLSSLLRASAERRRMPTTVSVEAAVGHAGRADVEAIRGHHLSNTACLNTCVMQKGRRL